MAKATKKLLALVEQPYEVVMTLSKEEAETLSDVLLRTGGDPQYTRRRYTDSILKAIREAGVVVKYGAEDVSKDNCSICFI